MIKMKSVNLRQVHGGYVAQLITAEFDENEVCTAQNANEYVATDADKIGAIISDFLKAE